MIAKLARRAQLVVATGGSFVLLLGLLVRLTIRDRTVISALLFYPLPWPVLAGGAAVLAVFWAHLDRRSLSRMSAVLATFALLAWAQTSWRLPPKKTPPAELRMVLWNVSRPSRGLPAIAQWLRTQDGDVLALAEAHRSGASSLAQWQRELPGYEGVELLGEMTCLVRGKILDVDYRPGPGGLKSALLHLEVRGYPLTLLQIDIKPSLWKSRRQELSGLIERARPHFGENLVVLGDFNTPRESAFLDPLRAELTEAFATAGSGFAETWPMPVPVLSLDQIWSSSRLRAVRCTHAFSLRSDHRAVVADFVFTAP